MKTIEFLAGTHIENAALQLVEACPARCLFNEIELIADEGSTVQQIVAFFGKESTRRAEEYRNSPEGQKAAKEAEDRRLAAQQAFDFCMEKLPSLDFKNDAAVLDWFCEIQGSADHIGIVKSKDKILTTFALHGMYKGVNCGDEFNSDDRENFFRYLVGQCLDGFASVGAPHGIIHKFTAEWKQKFLTC